jgi:CRISPR-associated protein Csb2
MTVIELQFPAGGRLHTTPWGRHVNEGAIEWPPSPWRIQRALVATWYLKAREEISRETMVSLMDSLAAVTPTFELPPAVQSHTRHYMPTKGGDKTKVFDTFIQSCQPVRIDWPTALNDANREALAILCERLGYLGRAESIVEAELLPSETSIASNSFPLPENEPLTQDQELVHVLCPETPEHYSAWLANTLTTESAPAKTKKSKGKAKSPSRELPSSIFGVLHAETGILQAQGWQQPPGSRWVDYTRPINAFQPKAFRPSRKIKNKITVARFAISSSVLPRITQAVSVADRFHKTLVSYADKRQIEDPSIFSGLGQDNRPLCGHQHTHIFCELGEKRDTIGYVTLYAPRGFDDAAQAIIEDVQLRRLWGKDGHDIDLILLGFGDERTFDSSLFATSAKWRSLTPFVSTKHLKTYNDGRPKLNASGWQQGSAAACLLQHLEQDPRTKGKLTSGGLKQDREGIRLPQSEKRLRCLQFQTRRPNGGGQRGNGDAGAFTLEFNEPVSGPLAFGFASHFGLGLFVPADS